MEIEGWNIRETAEGAIIVQAEDGSGVVVTGEEKDIGRVILYRLAANIMDVP